MELQNPKNMTVDFSLGNSALDEPCLDPAKLDDQGLALGLKRRFSQP